MCDLRFYFFPRRRCANPSVGYPAVGPPTVAVNSCLLDVCLRWLCEEPSSGQQIESAIEPDQPWRAKTRGWTSCFRPLPTFVWCFGITELRFEILLDCLHHHLRNLRISAVVHGSSMPCRTATLTLRLILLTSLKINVQAFVSAPGWSYT